jgi:hypothetical protein
MDPYQWTDRANFRIPISPDPLVGSSRQCMDCHDGSTPVDAYLNEFPVGSSPMTASYINGYGNTVKRYITDLSVTHPIGFLFTDALQSGSNLKPGLSLNSTYLGNSNSSVTIGSRLDSGFMTCSTCHDLHNELDTASSQPNYLLLGGPKKVDLCLTCHTHVDNPYAHNRTAWSPGTTVNGTCGTSNGATFSTAPTAALCATAANTPFVSGTGPWTWTCNGVYQGTDATCSANLAVAGPSLNGVCGASNGGSFASAPATGLCSAGTATALVGSGPWNWSCAGSNGGTADTCSAYYAATLTTTAAPVAGSYSGGTVPVTLSTLSGATVYYTTDGSTPTTSSSVYSAPITISGNVSLKYFAKNATATEPVKTSTYSVTPSGTPATSFSGLKAGSSFTITRSQGGGSYTPVATSTSTSFSDTSSLLPNTIYRYAVASDTDPTQTAFMTIHTPLYQGWNILGVPYATTGIDPASFFLSPISAIYQWVPTGATPEASNSQLGAYATVSSFTPGNGYFIKALNSGTMLVSTGKAGPSSATVTLKPGWTMIADPNSTNKTNIGSTWLIDGNPLSQAISANKIGGGLYWWNGTTYDSWTILGDNPQVEPWKGYWIVNIDNVNHTLTIQ